MVLVAQGSVAGALRAEEKKAGGCSVGKSSAQQNEVNDRWASPGADSL